jgi:colanic acid/amylovoran biosynthesis glycosyltransferase
MIFQMTHHLAYVFERFPTFTQTFCVREIMELERLGVRPILFSIHSTREEVVRHYPEELADRVHVLPDEAGLVEEIKQLKDANLLPQSVVLTLRHWGDRPDKMRVYEAAWIGYKLASLAPEVKHVHSHFAGVGARACWWLRKFHGHSYSFTAHANDIFCTQEETLPTCKTLGRDASLIVTVSDYTARDLRDRFCEPGNRVQRVYNGLDLQPFIKARQAADRRKSAGGILSVGRLIEKKGYDDLITACGVMRDRGLTFKCRIVGEGPLEETLRTQIATLNLSSHVELTGPKPMTEIIRLLAEETQIFALACKTERSGGRDNLPTVLMEAMAASLPCVSTKLAGVPEMVVDGLTGLLCDENQPEAFAGLLETLLKDEPKCEQMGRAGLDHARKHFEKSVTASALLHAFAARSGLRFDFGLAMKHCLLADHTRRTLCSDPQLRHEALKARDKGFDLAQFMGSAQCKA